MIETLEQLLATARAIYGPDLPHKPLKVLEALARLDAGEDVRAVARDIRTTAKNLGSIAGAASPIEAAFGASLSAGADDTKLKKVRRTLGTLIAGQLAEREFEKIYKDQMGTKDLRLEDDRSAHNDTDYRVLDGGGRPVFRINIKFFGTQFDDSKELVGLESSDCFGLATYKINQGMEKQAAEDLPYLFVIVGVPDLTGDVVGAVVPEDLTHFCSFIREAPKATGKRHAEDCIVQHLTGPNQPDEIASPLGAYAQRLSTASWYVLSAMKADRLLRQKLFERVYAVRVRGFAKNYGGAELNMHFSLSDDLTPLPEFLATLKSGGIPKVTHMFAAGKM